MGGTLDPKGPMPAETCAQRLREYCKANGTATQRPLAYIGNPNLDNATVQADQYAAVFLLTRGDYAWIGYGYRGCKSQPYPRPAEWEVDYGAPNGVCAETHEKSMVFERKWSKATVQWDCNAQRGRIEMNRPEDAVFVL